MAPEIRGEKTYQGKKVDVFALGVILFILIAGHRPFGKASKLDGYYSKFYENNANQFWKWHCSTKPEGFYGEDFKNLVTRMLSPNPSDRPSAQEVLESSWLSPIVLKKTRCFSA